jgi:hypothetical protein
MDEQSGQDTKAPFRICTECTLKVAMFFGSNDSGRADDLLCADCLRELTNIRTAAVSRNFHLGI